MTLVQNSSILGFLILTTHLMVGQQSADYKHPKSGQKVVRQDSLSLSKDASNTQNTPMSTSKESTKTQKRNPKPADYKHPFGLH